VHFTDTSPALTSWSPGFAAPTASVYPVAMGTPSVTLEEPRWESIVGHSEKIIVEPPADLLRSAATWRVGMSNAGPNGVLGDRSSQVGLPNPALLPGSLKEAGVIGTLCRRLWTGSRTRTCPGAGLQITFGATCCTAV